ncbi:hypothetical protein FXO38_10264 [Capsicum annuum]|uniref:Uncharacterized protein n=1 Tax=Capsicum annuum TaxID=4072 RepID=A0A2G2ZLC3_CAPAN|nr:hypothetical protein FXO38_10264 [Capsicum annuum]PHT82745.1 hypothetical protein T459_11188 [Capsicum annuum]
MNWITTSYSFHKPFCLVKSSQTSHELVAYTIPVNNSELTELISHDSTMALQVKKKDGMVKMQGSKEGRKGQLAIDAEIFEITPAFHVVEVKKKSGDTAEYMKFCDQGLKPSLKDIVWTWQGNEQNM